MPSTPTGVETPDVIDLRKQQRKEPEKPLYQVSIYIYEIAPFPSQLWLHCFSCSQSFLCFVKVLEEKEEKIAAGTLLGTTHTYVIGTGAQDKAAAKRVLIYDDFNFFLLECKY